MTKPLPDHLLMRRRNGTVTLRGMVPDRRTKAFRDQLTRVQLFDAYLVELEAVLRRRPKRE